MHSFICPWNSHLGNPSSFPCLPFHPPLPPLLTLPPLHALPHSPSLSLHSCSARGSALWPHRIVNKMEASSLSWRIPSSHVRFAWHLLGPPASFRPCHPLSHTPLPLTDAKRIDANGINEKRVEAVCSERTLCTTKRTKRRHTVRCSHWSHSAAVNDFEVLANQVQRALHLGVLEDWS